jgi:hypothetical protein
MMILLVGLLLVAGGIMWLQRSRANMFRGQNGTGGRGAITLPPRELT